jgi:hypothetical protein
MKTLLAFLICLLSLVTTQSADWIQYDPAARVPFYNDPNYTRCDYDWWVSNSGQSSDLYLNGVYVSSETGTFQLRLLRAWGEYQPYGCPIGIVDTATGHGLRVKDIAEKTARSIAVVSNSLRVYPDDVAAGISNFVATGFKAIVVTIGTGDHAGVSNACRYAEAAGALVVCAVPNAGVNIDVTPDYPSSWAHEITSIVPVTNLDRNGVIYGPNAAARGTNTFGSPGRNIIGNGTYSSGTSYATAIAAGILALGVEHAPGKSSFYYRYMLEQSSTKITGTRRINAANFLSLIHHTTYGIRQ